MPERPRVLHLGPDPASGGGMAAALAALLDSPLAELYELDVIVTYGGPNPVRRFTVFLWALLGLTAWSLRRRGRIVHIHATVRGSAYRKALCVLLAHLLRRRVVLHVHSGAGDIAAFSGRLRRPARRLIGAAFASADAILAVSEATARALRERCGVEVSGVVPNPAPTVALSPTPPERSHVEVPVVYLGGFANPVKGGETMVAAACLALAHEPTLKITLAGPGSPPAAAEPLIANTAGLTWVGWLGPSEKDALLRAAAVLAMPSLSEGLPMALLEAMAYRLAIVASAVGGIPELVDPGVDGILVPPGDAEALADALCELAADPALRERLAAAARSRAELLDAVEVSGRLADIYASLL